MLKAVVERLANRYPYMEKNIAFSYLFEHLMLETKSATPDFGAVIRKCTEIIYALRQALSASANGEELPEEEIIWILYRLTRIMDHKGEDYGAKAK